MSAVYERMTASMTSGNGVKGSAVSLGSVARDMCGFGLSFTYANNNRRFLADLMLGAEIIVPDMYFQPYTANVDLFIPDFAIPAGSDLQLRCQSNTITGVQVEFVGRYRKPGDRPRYSRAHSLTANAATGLRPSMIDLLTNDSWVELEDESTRDYAGFILQAGPGSSGPAVTQDVSFSLGAGGSGSEAVLGQYRRRVSTGSPNLTNNFSAPFEMHLRAGSRFAAKAAATTTTDTVALGALMLF